MAAFGALFARQLTESLGAATGPGVHISASGGQLNPATVNSLPALVRHDVFAAIADAIQHVFIWALPAAVVIFVLAWFIKEVPLRGRAPAGRGRQRAAGAGVLAGGNPRSSPNGPWWQSPRPVRVDQRSDRQAPTYGTASRISTVLARPFGSE